MFFSFADVRTRRKGSQVKVEHRPIEGIKPYEGNPRRNEAAVDAVAESIRQFGFRQPIVVDEDGVIVVGHWTGP